MARCNVCGKNVHSGLVIDKECLEKLKSWNGRCDELFNEIKARDKIIAEYEDKIERGELVEVVRCGVCAYYHKAHVLCNDGVERDISELPKEALDFTGTSVTIKYGINVGGQCELEKNCGYAEDKSVFRNPNDFCSCGERSVEK